MTRWDKILIFVFVLEAGAAAVMVRRHLRTPLLPVIDWTLLESRTAREIQDAEQACVASSSEPGKWFDLAETYRAFGLLPQASYCYQKLVRLKPNDSTYQYHYALCLDALGETAAARQLYQAVASRSTLEPDGVPVQKYCFLNQGQDLLRQENVAAALPILRQAVPLPKASLWLARALYRSGGAAEAAAVLDNLLKMSPGLVEANQMKAWVEEELGHQRQAEHFIQLSLRSPQRLNRWDPTYQNIQARRQRTGSLAWHYESLILEEQGKLELAHELSQKALAAQWTEDKAYQLAKLKVKLGRVAEALPILDESMARVGASSQALDLKGAALLQLGRSDQARATWENETRLDDNLEARTRLAEWYRAAGQQELSRKQQGMAAYFSGKEAWLNNEIGTAFKRFEQSVQLNNQFDQAWFYLGECRRLLGYRNGAAEAYRQCLVINPGHGRAARALESLSP